jgi:PDZ domain-containing protein
MQRRGITVLVGAVVIALLGLGIMKVSVPYVVLVPGLTVDTLGEYDGQTVIEIEGEVDDATGELRLTTVSVRTDPNLMEAIRAWFDGEEAVVPEELIIPPGQTREQVEEENTEQFSRSQSAAEAAAMRYLGFPARVSVADVVEGGAADGNLQVGDIVTDVDGEKVVEPADLGGLVTAQPVGTTLTVGYLRNGEPGEAELTTQPDADDPEIPRIGVVAATVVDHPYELDIRLEDIGGPSAGLMFALGIIDKLEPEDLTGGDIIAGTGTINGEGTVGPIGGLPQKLVGAREAGATVFLVPAANCPEAVDNPQPGMTLVEVETLADALEGLAEVRAGGTPRTCD